MRKISRQISLLILLLIVTVASVPGFSAPSAPDIRIGSKAFSPSSGSPYVDSNGMIEVPVAAFAQVLGCKVSTDTMAKRLIIKRPDNIQIKIGNGESYIETPYGTLKMLTPAVSKNGILFIPVTYAADVLGYSAKLQNGSKVLVNVTKGKNIISCNIDHIYKYYKLFLTGNMTGGATADLDKDGMPELLTITRDSRESDLYITVYKGSNMIGSISLGDNIDTAPANYPTLSLYKDAAGKDYIGISGGRSNQYGNSEELILYYVKNSKLISAGNFKCYDGTGIHTSTINNKEYKGTAKYKQAVAGYKLTNKLAELHPYNGTGDYTLGGDAVLKKYSEEERLWSDLLKTAVLSPAQKIKFGITKELVGANIGDTMDMSKLSKYSDGEGAAAYSLNQGTGAGHFRVFLSGRTLSSAYAIKGANIFGVTIGKDGTAKIQQIFGNGATVKKAAGRFMAPTGTVSSKYYRMGDYQIEFFLDKNGITISAFIRHFEGRIPA